MFLSHLLCRLLPQLQQYPLPISEALPALYAHGSVSVGDLPVQHRVLGGHRTGLNEPGGALVALLTADALFKTGKILEK